MIIYNNNIMLNNNNNNSNNNNNNNNNNSNNNYNNNNNNNNNNLFAERECGRIQERNQFRVKYFYHRLAISTSNTIIFIFNSIACRQCAGRR